MKKVWMGMLSALLALCLFSGCKKEAKELEVTFLKVGKADAIVILKENHCILIDCGEEDDGGKILAFLKSKKIESVDTMIITHLDKDHVGGAAQVLSGIAVQEILLPDYENDTNAYLDMLKTAWEKEVPLTYLQEKREWLWMEVQLSVTVPASSLGLSEKKEIDNNMSLITLLKYQETAALFCGDAENERLNQFLDDEEISECALVKLPHHGEYQKSLKRLLELIRPEHAVICDSDKNPAEEKTLELLKENSVSVWETRIGNITAVSDGKKWSVSQ